jgi:hypothetical protein
MAVRPQPTSARKRSAARLKVSTDPCESDVDQRFEIVE